MMSIDVLNDSLEDFYGRDIFSDQISYCYSRRSATTTVSSCRREANHGGSCTGVSPSGRTYSWKRTWLY